jgi:hypothetical protein
MSNKMIKRISKCAAALTLIWAIAVWAGAPAGSYTLATNTVLDKKTGLTWQRSAPVGTFTWANASGFCQSLTLDGATWRLPTVKELQTIFDVRAFSPAIDSVAFPNTSANEFWSSTNYSYPWVLDFGSGYASRTSVTIQHYVRCVH